jgi:hypothetical protein
MNVSVSIKTIATCLVVFTLVIIPTAAHAERASSDEATMVSQNWLSYIVHQKGNWAGDAEPTIARVEEIVEEGVMVGYLYHIDPVGYIVVPLLKELAPVKVTSEEYDLNIDDEDGMAALTREMLLDGVRAFEAQFGNIDASQPSTGDVPFGREYRAQWDRYAVSNAEFETALKAGQRDTLVSVGPLMTAHWHQGYPYKMYCPMGDGGQCIVGCVATATAMIMYYHQWPPFGVDSARHYWTGDESCGGSTPGMWLNEYIDDPYDWDNMLDYVGSNYPEEQKAAVAELNYEVGVAWHMQYGVCGSGSYVTYGLDAFHEMFRYKDSVVRTNRPGITAQQWFDACHEDLDRGLPITYRITRHNIVLDGYRIVDGINQQHFNYGWNSSHSTWYTVDYLYCNWDGCNAGDQMMLTKIIPDRRVMFSVDTTIGWLPLTVGFDGSSDLEVENWVWDFGDGDTTRAQSPVHTYNTPGCFDVNLEVQAGADTCSLVRPHLVIAIADTISAISEGGAPDSTAVLVIHARNSAPLKDMRIPIEFAGEVAFVYDSFSTAGCRTDYFEEVELIHYAPISKRATFRLLTSATLNTQPDLSPGYGPVLKIYFSVPSNTVPGQSVPILLGGYTSYLPMYYSRFLDYQPETTSGSLDVTSCCMGMRGNVDEDPADEVTISDLIYLVDHMFSGGPAPTCPKEADIDGSLTLDVSDLIYLVDYMFAGGYAPLPCW